VQSEERVCAKRERERERERVRGALLMFLSPPLPKVGLPLASSFLV